MQKKERRSQEERTSQTTEKLRQATIQLIAEVGFVHTTTLNISKRAGVSRGAMLHHYQNKTELVIDATSQMWNASVKTTQELCRQFAAGELSLDNFVEALWAKSFDETYVTVTIDMMIAARGDEALAQHLEQSLGELLGAYKAVAGNLFAGSGLTPDQQEIAMSVLFSVLRGLRIQEMMRSDVRLAKGVRDVLKLMLSQMLAGQGLPESSLE